MWSVTVIQTETRVPIGTLWACLRSVAGHSQCQTETRVPIGTLWVGLRSVVGHSQCQTETRVPIGTHSRSYRNAMGGASGLRIFKKRYNSKTVQDRAIVTMADK